jgi:hypothetical protein
VTTPYYQDANAVGVEIDESYCETTARRLAQDCLTFETTP